MQTLKKKTCTAVLIEYYQSRRVAKEYNKDNVEVYHRRTTRILVGNDDTDFKRLLNSELLLILRYILRYLKDDITTMPNTARVLHVLIKGKLAKEYKGLFPYWQRRESAIRADIQNKQEQSNHHLNAKKSQHSCSLFTNSPNGSL